MEDEYLNILLEIYKNIHLSDEVVQALTNKVNSTKIDK